ncbi:YppF family protein [Metabacillus indicus]|uniref:YppF family protein n=1 Tax=Metabacillus indicus TaxID=246786 RepID=UPI003CFA32C4
MNLQSIQSAFLETKKYEPTSISELMNFIKTLYIKGEMTISEYRTAVMYLEASEFEKISN